jgi:hypothetical protein
MTTVVGVSMVKNEVDVIEGTLRHMAHEVDFMVVADNGSTDGTLELLHELTSQLPLQVVLDDDPAYYQSAKMTVLADSAAEQCGGNLWVVPFDADEIWSASGMRVRAALDHLDRKTSINVADARLYNHWVTALDGDELDPFLAMRWRQADPAPLGKVAFKWEPGAVIEQGNHGVWLPNGVRRETYLRLDHFPYRSAEQFVAKAVQGAAAYKAAPDLPEDWGAHWRAYGRIYDQGGFEALAEVFRTHFSHLSPIDAGMVEDPAPYRRWE